MNGEIAIEVSRRLKGTIGVAITPAALRLNNFNIVGRLKNSDGTVGWEGTGGWSWKTYSIADGMVGVRLSVSEITDVRVNQNSLYNIDGFGQKVYISEINATGGTGYIFAAYYGKDDIYNEPSLMPTSGKLIKISGEGQEEIIFTSSKVEAYQPFWNTETDSFDIKGYVDKYCDGHLEYICIQLGINSILGIDPYSGNYNSIINDAKQLLMLIHEQLPDTKIMVATLTLPSQNGGIGYSYAAGDVAGSYLTTSVNYKWHKINDLYRELKKSLNYIQVVEICAECDSDYNYPYEDIPVNTRSSDTERIGTNGVHLTNNGYWQIADSWFRSILAS